MADSNVTYRILHHIRSSKSNLSRRTLRITSIPLCIPHYELMRCLEELPTQHGWRSANGSNIKALTMISDARSQVATVAFYEEPFCVMECAPGKSTVIEIKAKGDVHHAKVDCDFLGMTPLYSSNDDIFVDIVAVTGLAGHPFGSWKAPGTDVMWLRDLLPKDIPHSRIFTYGYDSRVEKSINNSSISDYARQLLEELGYLRQTETSKGRPLIFIAHSLGGLVVKAALAAAAQSSSHIDDAIWQSTEGVFFFGVPNTGLNHENLLSVVENQRNAGLVRNLMEGSEVLQLLNNYFKSIWRDRSHGCYIVSFFETMDTPSIVDVAGNLKREGPMIRMVSRESATLSSVDPSDHVPITGNHSTIVKFTGYSDPGYRSVVARILLCIQSTRDLVTNKLGSKSRNNPLIPENTIKSIFMVPMPRNPNYVALEDVHRQLDGLLVPKNDTQLRAALWELGGMGKTTIALEYCYRYWKEHSTTSVFWVHANTDEAFQASYRDIFKRIGIRTLYGDEGSLQDAVKNWLESSESGEWLMVIDNLDNLELESKYIPIRKGMILFTTRDSRILGDPRFSVPTNARVEVRKMSLTEASSMCRTHGMTDSDATQLSAQVELLELLENLPLAIAQSAAYIRYTRMSTEQYLGLFKQSTGNQATLLDKPLYRSSKDDSSSRTVMKTWAITIDRIKAENPIAVEILQFMSVMDPERIPLDIIRGVPRFKSVGDLDVLEGIGLLLNFAILTLLEPYHYRLHRLVSFWSRKTLRREKRQDILHAMVGSLQQSFPKDMEAHLPTCSQLLPHATTILKHIQESDMKFDEITMFRLQHSVAAASKSMGEYVKAREWYQRALDGYEKTLGKDHPSTLTTVNNMAIVFETQGEYGKALEWYQRALDGKEKTLGKEHPSTLTTVNNMAIVFRSQGEYGKALEWYQRALDGREKKLGKEHSSTLDTVHNMAFVFDSQGEYGKALEWYQRALDGCEKTLGKEHPSTLTTVNNMAIVFETQGEYGKVLEWYQRALDGKEKTLGKDHPSTLTTANNIASLLRICSELHINTAILNEIDSTSR